MSSNQHAARSAIRIGSFISILTVASLGAKLATADSSPDIENRARAIALARVTGGDLSDRSLHQAFNADVTGLFSRHDPALKPKADADLLKGYEQGAPLNHLDLTPQQAQNVNQSIPVSPDVKIPAKPFILRANATDRVAATTCLTQAVYYEAGFEPVEGAQAVAQVVLNRVRHPIFPKTVCGVVYQGSEFKTGCQFSFTCDGSLQKIPAAAAWERARVVAQKALNGYVQKDVGESTHYHTQWIVPWWAPTVTKVAQVGVQIFYRWPGSLGMPGAFNGHYAGNEHVAGPSPVGTTPYASPEEIAANDRAHVVLAEASAVAPTEKVVVAKAQAAQVDLGLSAAALPALQLSQIANAKGSASAGSFGCIGGICRK